MNYQKYCNDMKQHKQQPMEETAFNLMMGIDTDKSEPCFLSVKYTKLKDVVPSLKEHEKRVKL